MNIARTAVVKTRPVAYIDVPDLDMKLHVTFPASWSRSQLLNTIERAHGDGAVAWLVEWHSASNVTRHLVIT